MMNPIKVSAREELALDFLIIAALIFFSFFYQGYKFGIGGQVIEIPLLRNLVDPSFYSNDPFIPHVHRYFITFTYRIVAFFVRDTRYIYPSYIVLTVIAWTALVASCYLAFKQLYKSRYAGSFAVMAGILSFVWCSNTFGHEEAALALTFIAIYCIARQRFVSAAAFLGLACNFHILNTFWFCLAFVVLTLASAVSPRINGAVPRNKIILSYIVMGTTALPIAVWVVRNMAGTAAGLERLADFDYGYILSRQQFFWFEDLSFSNLADYWGWSWIIMLGMCILLTVKFLQNCRRIDMWPTYFIALFALLFLGPVVFFMQWSGLVELDFLARIDLWRNLHFLRWVLFPLIAATEVKIFQNTGGTRRLFSGFILLSFINGIFLSVALIIATIYDSFGLNRKRIFAVPEIFAAILVFSILFYLQSLHLNTGIFHLLKYAVIASLPIIFIFLFIYIRKKSAGAQEAQFLSRALAVLVVGAGILTGLARIIKEETRMQFEPYKQNIVISRDYKQALEYIRDNTPKDSLILTDPEEKNFHIFSERSALISAQLNFILFDESLARKAADIYKDLGGVCDEKYSVANEKYGFKGLTSSRLVKVAKKYNVTHMLLRKEMPHPEGCIELFSNDGYRFLKVQ